jgi:hypothetical protein
MHSTMRQHAAAPEGSECPFLVPVLADRLWLYPVSVYCRRPDQPIRIPAASTLARVCTADYPCCPLFMIAQWHSSIPADTRLSGKPG